MGKDLEMENNILIEQAIQTFISKINDNKENSGLVAQVSIGIFSSIMIPSGEWYLLDIRDSLYDCMIEAILSEDVDIFKGSIDWSEEIKMLEDAIEIKTISSGDRILFFLLCKVLEIFKLVYQENRIKDALFLVLAMRTFVLNLVEIQRSTRKNE